MCGVHEVASGEPSRSIASPRKYPQVVAIGYPGYLLRLPIMKHVLFLGAIFTSVHGNPVVQGPLGIITGKFQTVLDTEVESFLGIPYAKPPVGNRRFALPETFGTVGNLSATEYSRQCPQPYLRENEPGRWHLDEDCLYLNVFRKRGTAETEGKAVIAIIHGGGYIIGTASESYVSPASLVAFGDVIVVSFNYRLGIFGFADMKELAPGNLGLYDQRLALQWIQDHIGGFGGNPEKVTVIGVSAGSMSLSAQIITPIDEKNLFQSAVLDAGVFAGFDEDSESSFTRVKKIAKKLGCPVGSSEMLDCLRRAKTEHLLPLSFSTTGDNGMKSFVATTDGKFVPKDVEDYVALNSAKLRKVRTIIGNAKNEGTMFVGSSLLDRDFPNPRTREETLEYLEIVSSSYNHPLDYSDASTKSMVGKLYIDEYPGDSFRSVAELQSDVVFKCPVYNFVRSYSRHNDEVYVYQFDRKLRSKYGWGPNPEISGAFHASPYLHFSGSLLLGTDPVDPEDKPYIIDAIKMITDFAKTDEAPAFRGKKWPAFSASEDVFVFDDTAFVRKGFSNEGNCQELFPQGRPRTLEAPRSEL